MSAWFLPPAFVFGYVLGTWLSRNEFNAMTRIAERALAISEELTSAKKVRV